MIILITVNNQKKQDKGDCCRGDCGGRRGTICFCFVNLLRNWLFSYFPSGLLMHSKLSAAYAAWHHAQRGSGTYADSPGSFREAGCCLFGCSQPKRGDSLHSDSFSASRDSVVGGRTKFGWEGKADVYTLGSFSGMGWGSLGDLLYAEQWFGVGSLSCLYYMINRKLHGDTYDKHCNAKEVTTGFTLRNCSVKNVADLFCKYFSGGKYTAMHWVSMSAWFMLCLITFQVTSLSFPFILIPIFVVIVPRKITGTVLSL